MLDEAVDDWPADALTSAEREGVDESDAATVRVFERGALAVPVRETRALAVCCALSEALVVGETDTGPVPVDHALLDSSTDVDDVLLAAVLELALAEMVSVAADDELARVEAVLVPDEENCREPESAAVGDASFD